MTKSSWMQMFGPTLVRQAVWMNLGGALVVPIDSTSTRQWKKKVRVAFGVEEIAPGRQVVALNTYKGPAQQPDQGDLTEEWARQIRELSAKEKKNSTPRIEITTHLPLGNIKAFSGYRNKREKSMQWLRTFIYEMKETHTPPNDWCMAFELSLQDGALHWYRQLSRKTRPIDAFIKYYCSKFNQSAKARYYSAKRKDKEHVCDYLNWLNGYARNAGVQFENGGREAKDHVEHFLDTCDDRGLEERLCHVRVKDIHDLEGMVNDILKRRDRKSKRDSSNIHDLEDMINDILKRRDRKSKRDSSNIHDLEDMINDILKRRDRKSKRDSSNIHDLEDMINDILKRRDRKSKRDSSNIHDLEDMINDILKRRDRKSKRDSSNIHDLEDMINDILKRRDRKSKRDSSVRRSSGRNEDSRSNYRRGDRRRDVSPYRPRITLPEALSDLVNALNKTSVGSQTSQQASYDQEYELNEDSFDDGDDEDRYSNRGSEYDYAGEDERGHVAAANDHEHRAAAEGSFARSDNRRPKGDGHFNNDRGFARDNRNGRQQYGSCARV
ncbi:LOW QUALITY PROTEIN: hypothetical protein PHMEG_00032309 [Phytophthora megakarya]|uniref:Retrotransposon gag domain-containing protein n=1 Tax=Phytophthora megakarya TaxID=4795 RepID=A0A225UYF5_9STRA|nr:LOW QUALITY PROTEIN: hypothetical protein PHMEG_00032309 [Phytophthora megakarya]